METCLFTATLSGWRKMLSHFLIFRTPLTQYFKEKSDQNFLLELKQKEIWTWFFHHVTPHMTIEIAFLYAVKTGLYHVSYGFLTQNANFYFDDKILQYRKKKLIIYKLNSQCNVLLWKTFWFDNIIWTKGFNLKWLGFNPSELSSSSVWAISSLLSHALSAVKKQHSAKVNKWLFLLN